MSNAYCAVLWIDYDSAQVVFYDSDYRIVSAIYPYRPSQTLRGEGVAHGNDALFRNAAEGLRAAKGVLLLGPSGAKDAFARFAAAQAPDVAARIRAVLPMDRASDDELVAKARELFGPAGCEAAPLPAVAA